jgi:hypothetical protein
VLIAYLDESYTKDRYYIAAFVIDEADTGLLAEAVADAVKYAEGFGIAPDTELHAHEIMSGKKAWAALRGQHRAAIAVYQRALDNIAALPGVMYVRGLDIPRLHARYRYPNPPHEIVLQHLLEEVSDYGRSRGQQVLIIADEIPDQEAHKTQVLSYQAVGTPGYKPNKLAYIEKPISFANSAMTPGLQVADLIAYLYRRHNGHVEKDQRARKAVEKLWETLRPIWGAVWVWTP